MTKPTNDSALFREAQTGRGKREHQKIKPYLVLQYLMQHTDEEHTASAAEIVAYFQEYYGIDTERRSIYSDIDEINKVLYMLDNGCPIQEAEEVIDDEEEGEEEKFIVYDKNRKGFFVRQRKYDLNDVRLLAECVYSARFIDEKRARRLVELTQSFVSPQSCLTEYGQIIEKCMDEAASLYSVSFDNYVIMPDHIHFICRWEDDRATARVAPTLGRIVGALKSSAANQCRKAGLDGKLWQRGYYEHVIRSVQDYRETWEYIDGNPARWLDKHGLS